jgi:GrpB-like predicted nucleotidyltransferase (UPF0157 family)
LKIEVTAYQHFWPALFTEEKRQIQQALGHIAAQVEHIGSTAVKGLPAKPIIDILLGVREMHQLNELIELMQAAGYTYYKKYEEAMPYRRYFVKFLASVAKEIPELVDVDDLFKLSDTCKSVVHIHAMEIGTYHWERHLAFRDYLRVHVEARQKYGDWKLHLSGLDFEDSLAYNAAKNTVVQAIQSRAITWYKSAPNLI